jgi:hypothetical protein
MQITYNVVVQPGEEKYRRLKLSNAKIRSSIADAEGGLGAMRELGWRLGEDEGQEVLTLAKGLATMAQVGLHGCLVELACVLLAGHVFGVLDGCLGTTVLPVFLPNVCLELCPL